MTNEYKSLRIIGLLIIVLIYNIFSHAYKDISFGFHSWFVDGGLAISCRLSKLYTNRITAHLPTVPTIPSMMLNTSNAN